MKTTCDEQGVELLIAAVATEDMKCPKVAKQSLIAQAEECVRINKKKCLQKLQTLNKHEDIKREYKLWTYLLFIFYCYF